MSMALDVRVREIFRTFDHHNPISGHRWTTHGPTTGYEVVGPYGPVSRHRSEAHAVKAAAEWREFYERHAAKPAPQPDPHNTNIATQSGK